MGRFNKDELYLIVLGLARLIEDLRYNEAFQTSAIYDLAQARAEEAKKLQDKINGV